MASKALALNDSGRTVAVFEEAANDITERNLQNGS